MSDHRRCPGNLTVRSNIRAAGYSYAGCNRSVCAYTHVVRYLYLIIELAPTLNNRVVQCASVNGRIGANFNIILDHDTTQLRDLLPPPLMHDHSETIRSDHNAGVEYAAITQANR
jgi:hypothetical protein